MANKVSVIITAYNKEEFIKETINSVLNQSFKDFELIVINDGSTDLTAEKILEVNDERIQIYHQENLGIAKTRNKGIELSQGQYIAYLDGDDIWHKDKLLYQYDALSRNPKVCLATCYALLIDKNSKVEAVRVGDKLNGNVYESVLKNNGIASCSAPLLIKDLLVEVGGFTSDYDGSEDYEMWIKLAQKYPFITVEKDLVGYRRNYSSISKNYEKILNNNKLIFKKYIGENQYMQYLGFTYYILAAMSYMDKNYDDSFSYIKTYFASVPFFKWKVKSLLLYSVLLIRNFLPEQIVNNLFMNYLPSKFFKMQSGKFFN